MLNSGLVFNERFFPFKAIPLCLKLEKLVLFLFGQIIKEKYRQIANHTFFTVQWNPGLTICQGDVKMISLNQDIVISGFPV